VRTTSSTGDDVSLAVTVGVRDRDREGAAEARIRLEGRDERDAARVHDACLGAGTVRGPEDDIRAAVGRDVADRDVDTGLERRVVGEEAADARAVSTEDRDLGRRPSSG